MGEKSAAGAARAAAVRAAHEVSARRAKQLQEREAKISHVLADYFEAKAHGEKIRTHAQERAGHLVEAAKVKIEKIKAHARAAGEELTAQAEKDAADYDAQVGAAVRRLVALGESRASVAQMTGLSQAVIRSMEREHGAAPRAEPPASAQHPASSARTAPKRST